MRNSDRAGLLGMLELVMTAADTDESPTICLQFPYQVTAVHSVYYTHLVAHRHGILRPTRVSLLNDVMQYCPGTTKQTSAFGQEFCAV